VGIILSPFHRSLCLLLNGSLSAFVQRLALAARKRSRFAGTEKIAFFPSTLTNVARCECKELVYQAQFVKQQGKLYDERQWTSTTAEVNLSNNRCTLEFDNQESD